MISVNGNFGDEVFLRLATDTRLSQREREAARKIGEAMKAQREYAVSITDVPPDDRPEPPAIPAHWRNFELACYGHEFCRFDCGAIHFALWPYTTGQSVNVNVSERQI